MNRSKFASFTAVIVIAAMASLSACKVDDSSDVKTAPDATHSAAAATGAEKVTKNSAARLGQSITIAGNEKGSRLSVAVVRVRTKVHSTDGFSSPDRGKKYVAIQFRLRNTGAIAYDDSPSNGAKVIDTLGQQFDADPFSSDVNVGATLPASVKIAPGGRALGYLVFQIPRASHVAKVQFSMDSGFAETAEWTV